jgi:pimeloyl-ACP methyl ester carboxylesterase
MGDAALSPYLPQRVARFEEVAGRRGRIALTCWGPPSAAPVYLLHGYMDCAAAWQLLVDQLPADWPLVAIDWAGYGRSAHHGSGYWMPEYLDELEQVLEQRSASAPARIIGHSLGGTVGAFYAGIRPERVRWLVDLEGLGLPRSLPAETPPRIRGWLEALRGAPVRTRRYANYAELTTALCNDIRI